MKYQAKHARIGLLERRSADLTVTLHGVWVAGIEQGAGLKYRKVERRADRQRLDVEVAAEQNKSDPGTTYVLEETIVTKTRTLGELAEEAVELATHDESTEDQ